KRPPDGASLNSSPSRSSRRAGAALSGRAGPATSSSPISLPLLQSATTRTLGSSRSTAGPKARRPSHGSATPTTATGGPDVNRTNTVPIRSPSGSVPTSNVETESNESSAQAATSTANSSESPPDPSSSNYSAEIPSERAKPHPAAEPAARER